MTRYGKVGFVKWRLNGNEARDSGRVQSCRIHFNGARTVAATRTRLTYVRMQ